MKIAVSAIGIVLVAAAVLMVRENINSPALNEMSEKSTSNQIMSETNEILKNSVSYTKPSREELKSQLTEIQFQVTQKDATERPFSNEYNDEKRDGIYVDIVSGEPLFSSKDKFDSGTGWPSFSRPFEPGNIVEKTDYKLLFPRTEVRSFHADSHLGHVFKDGPAPTGLRYCMNSAAMNFIPKEELAQAGYGQYVGLFE